ncbi:NYN domain-containing protein [Achromobacter denitrificans]
MNNPNESVSMALFCDFENVALGVRDTKFQKFDIRPVLERLLLKGSIVVKKAYCDWERYKEFKAPMHEANFELIEIPHVRQSGKNSADIRLVVDALDFCYTKSHVNTFVIISGDSDFSPLVSKLRENNKKVIGVGVKQSTSDLLIANCDEFIFYDDLAREGLRAADARRDNRGAGGGQRRTPDEERRRKEELEARKTQAVEMVVETFDALVAERGDSGKIWASALKDALKRRRPDFNESYYGFRAFGNLLDEAQSRGLLEVGREENAGTYVYRDSAGGAPAVNRAAGNGGSRPAAAHPPAAESDDAQEAGAAREDSRSRSARKSRGGRKAGGADRDAGQPAEHAAVEETAAAAPAAPMPAPAPAASPASPAEVSSQAAKDEETAREVAREAAALESMRADALARAQAPKPAQPSRLPPMPKPLPQARQPLPAVNIAEWTFAEPAAQSRQPSGKAPVRMSDPFEGGAASVAGKPEASPPAGKPAAKRGRSADPTPAAKAPTAKAPAAKTPAAKTPAAKTAPAKTAAARKAKAEEPASPAQPAAEAPAKPARKTAARRPRKTAEES